MKRKEDGASHLPTQSKTVGTTDEQHQAKRLLPVLKRKHLLLVTLLLFNAASAEALPLFLDELVPSYVAIILSVVCILIISLYHITSIHSPTHSPIHTHTHTPSPPQTCVLFIGEIIPAAIFSGKWVGW